MYVNWCMDHPESIFNTMHESTICQNTPLIPLVSSHSAARTAQDALLNFLISG
jgi:hypothetical protein